MTSPISFTVRPPSAPIRPSPLGNGLRAGPPSRRLFEQGAEDVEEEQGRSRSRPREERLEGFRNGRAHGSVAFLMHQSTADLGRSGERPAEPLVIPAIPNRDWRQSSTRRTPSFRPEDSGRNGPIETYERSGDQPARSGIRNEVRMEVGMNGETGKVEQTEEAVLPDGSASTSIVSVKAEPLSLEEQALRAILAGDAQQESEEERAQRELVIAMGGDGATTPMSEDEAFKRDVATLPKEVSSPKPLSLRPLLTHLSHHWTTTMPYPSRPSAWPWLAVWAGIPHPKRTRQCMSRNSGLSCLVSAPRLWTRPSVRLTTMATRRRSIRIGIRGLGGDSSRRVCW